MRQIITHFTDDDLYKFTMCCAIVENYPRAVVKYRFTDRHNTVYPAGFAEELRKQIESLESLAITPDEIEFMQRRCSYIPVWFYTYLRGFRYNSKLVSVSQDADCRLNVEFEGYWCETVLLEVKVLAIISELYYIMTGLEKSLDYDVFYDSTRLKASRLLDAGCVFSDFGTRRRASFAAQDTAVRALKEESRRNTATGHFAGSSNVYLCMKYDLKPMGTMAHEIVCALGAMYGPQMSNYLAMEMWQRTFRGNLGIYLYDTYGWRIFSLNFSEDFANMFKGLRVDSGDNKEQLDLIVEKYRSLGIDPCTKSIVFSNGLSTDSAIALQEYARQRCRPSFGIGTHFTNDFEGVTPLNIVIKLVAAKITETWSFFCPTCKLSEDKGKFSGDPEVVARFRAALNLESD